MNTAISINQLKNNFQAMIERAIHDHTPITVTQDGAENFVIISEKDWQSLEETLYVMQNDSLMRQICESLKTHNKTGGYQATQADLDEILCED